MNKQLYLIFIITFSMMISCSKKNNIPEPDTLFSEKIPAEKNSDIENQTIENKAVEINDDLANETIKENIATKDLNQDSTIVNEPLSNMINKNHFYELEKSMEEILLKISFLEKQLLLKENSGPTTSYTEKLKNLIDGPPMKHQISLKNESIIEGFIEKNTESNIMVMTNVGRLTIDKNEIEYIEEITTLEPDIIFIGHGLEQQFDDHYLFSGKVLNQGTLRGDFVRVIFQLWADDTNVIYSDSTFVEGNQIKYESGIVTDTSLNPNKSARYILNVPIEKDIPISYITREIRWIKYN